MWSNIKRRLIVNCCCISYCSFIVIVLNNMSYLLLHLRLFLWKIFSEISRQRVSTFFTEFIWMHLLFHIIHIKTWIWGHYKCHRYENVMKKRCITQHSVLVIFIFFLIISKNTWNVGHYSLYNNKQVTKWVEQQSNYCFYSCS